MSSYYLDLVTASPDHRFLKISKEINFGGFDKRFIMKVLKALRRGDTKLRSIELRTWELMAAEARHVLEEPFRKHGDYCIPKGVYFMKFMAEKEARELAVSMQITIPEYDGNSLRGKSVPELLGMLWNKVKPWALWRWLRLLGWGCVYFGVIVWSLAVVGWLLGLNGPPGNH